MNLSHIDPSAPIPAVARGRVERISQFQSRFVDPRHIDVWLPDGYDPNGRYAVLYMHDGQMLFDPEITWNRQSWGVAETAGDLIDRGAIRPCLVVGIWNSGGGRQIDYFPQKPFARLPAGFRDFLLRQAAGEDEVGPVPPAMASDAYLRFIVEECKPHIDATYATRPEREQTIIAGSSMGGLISLYALCEYPAVFGGAGCLSTHWIGGFPMENNPIPDAFVAYLQENLPDPAGHRLYFDYGTETLDAEYEPHQRRVDAVMRRRGYDASRWQTLKFAGADHSENAWCARLHRPLTFLLPPEPST